MVSILSLWAVEEQTVPIFFIGLPLDRVLSMLLGALPAAFNSLLMLFGRE